MQYNIIISEERSEIEDFLLCVCVQYQVAQTQELQCYDRHDFSCLCMRGDVDLYAFLIGIDPKFGLGLTVLRDTCISCKFLHKSIIQFYLAAIHDFVNQQILAIDLLLQL